MTKLTPIHQYRYELYTNACKRTREMGATSLEETIALLEAEINDYRKKIDELKAENKELSNNKDMLRHVMNTHYGMYGDAGKTVITINRTDVQSVDIYFKEDEKEGE